MRKILSVVLAAATLNSQIALAQMAPGHIELKNQSLVSLIYSDVYGTAMVGLQNDKNVTHYEECYAPHLAVGQRLTLGALDNCHSIPGTDFLADETTVERINAAYASKLPGAFVMEQRRIHDWQNLDFQEKRLQRGLIASLGVVAGFGGVYIASTRATDFYHSKNFAKASGLAALTMVAGTLLVLATIRLLKEFNEDGEDYPITSIENAATEAQMKMVISKQLPADSVIATSDMPALYPAMKSSLLEAIKDARTF